MKKPEIFSRPLVSYLLGRRVLVLLIMGFSAVGYTEDGVSLLRSLPAVGGYAQLEGVNDSYNTLSWRGIPFAEAPVGDLRWRAPRDVPAWEGVRDSSQFSAICSQLGSFFGDPNPTTFDQPIGEEDCLYLNIWRPQNTSADLPVLFWIHGGSNIKGAGSEHLYNGAAFADKANAVVVTVNYRVGSFGWFSNSALSEGDLGDDSGNFATLDLIKGLQWVRDNIGQFGGDANSVTIAGQSAGCINAWGLLQSPLAVNLVDRMLCTSGLPVVSSAAQGQQQSTDVINTLLIENGYASSAAQAEEFRLNQTDSWIRTFLRALPAEAIARHTPSGIRSHFTDGYVIPEDGYTSLLLGNYNKVPMILGNTKDEGTFFVGDAGFYSATDAEIWDLVNSQNPESVAVTDVVAAELVPLYRPLHRTLSLAITLTVDNICRYLSLLQDDVYRYDFEWDNSPKPWDEIFGALHGMDLPFLFGNFLNADQADLTRFMISAENQFQREALSDDFIQYVAQFMRNGNPNRLFDRLPYWYQWSNFWSAKKRLVLDSDLRTSSEDFWLSDVDGALNELSAAQRVEVSEIINDLDLPLEDANVEYQ